MSVVSGRHLFAYGGFRSDLEHILQGVVLFWRQRSCSRQDESSGVWDRLRH